MESWRGVERRLSGMVLGRGVIGRFRWKNRRGIAVSGGGLDGGVEKGRVFGLCVCGRWRLLFFYFLFFLGWLGVGMDSTRSDSCNDGVIWAFGV